MASLECQILNLVFRNTILQTDLVFSNTNFNKVLVFQYTNAHKDCSGCFTDGQNKSPQRHDC